MIIMNPVVISVAVMILLCLLNMNIVLALLVAAIAAGNIRGDIRIANYGDTDRGYGR